MWFQQDAATCHKAHTTTSVRHDDDMVISSVPIGKLFICISLQQSMSYYSKISTYIIEAQIGLGLKKKSVIT